MDKYVITIARQFGSMGRQVAQKMAQNLHIEYFDRDIVENAAQRRSLPAETVSRLEEKSYGKYFSMKFPLGRRSPSVKEQIFKAQKEFILNVAAKKSCIVVGRCSDAVLEDVPNHLHIYIYAPLSQRYDNCIHKLMLSPQAAGKMIEDVDRARENYHLQYAGYKPDDPAHKDIMINSAVLGIQGTADYLTELVRLKFGS